MSIIIIITENHYDSFFWWLFAIIFGLLTAMNFMIFDNYLEKHRCYMCNSWGLKSKVLKESSYKIDGYTTSSSRLSGDGKHRIITQTHHHKGEKEVKVYREVLMCHCTKCDTYYEIWQKGGKSGSSKPCEISKDRYEKSKVRYLGHERLKMSQIRVENSSTESFIYLHGDDDYDHDVFKNEECSESSLNREQA